MERAVILWGLVGCLPPLAPKGENKIFPGHFYGFELPEKYMCAQYRGEYKGASPCTSSPAPAAFLSPFVVQSRAAEKANYQKS